MWFLYVPSEAAESKLAKLETNRTVILPPLGESSQLCDQIGHFIGLWATF